MCTRGEGVMPSPVPCSLRFAAISCLLVSSPSKCCGVHCAQRCALPKFTRDAGRSTDAQGRVHFVSVAPPWATCRWPVLPRGALLRVPNALVVYTGSAAAPGVGEDFADSRMPGSAMYKMKWPLQGAAYDVSTRADPPLVVVVFSVLRNRYRRHERDYFCVVQSRPKVLHSVFRGLFTRRHEGKVFFVACSPG